MAFSAVQIYDLSYIHLNPYSLNLLFKDLTFIEIPWYFAKK